MATKNRIRSGARAGKSDTPRCPSPSDYPPNGCGGAQMLKPTPLKLTHQELHEKISKEVSAAIEPLKSYKDFLDYKGYLSSARTEARQLEDALALTLDRIAELERAVTQFAKSIKTEVEEALR